MKNKQLDLKNYLKNFKEINVGDEIPLIEYTPDYEIPKDLKFEEYETTIRNHDKEIRIKRYRLVGIIKNLEPPIKAKKIYKGMKRKYLTYKIKKRTVFIILKRVWPSNNLHIKKELIFRDHYLYFKVQKGYIGVWYKKGNRSRFVILPRYLKLDNLFWETFGILTGEMTKSTIAVSNTDPSVINHVIKFFDDSKLIDKRSWKFALSLNCREVKSEIENVINESRKYWVNQLGIGKNEIKNIYLYKQFKSNLNPNLGKIELRFFNKPLKQVIDFLTKFVEDNVLKDVSYSTSFLRGLIAAEGCPGIRNTKENKLSTIRIASKFEKERLFYAKICEKVNLKVKVYNGHNVEIFGIESFLKALELNLFALNEKRNKHFIERLNNLDTIKAIKLLINNNLSVREIVDKLNLKDHRNINKNFSRLVKLDILNRIKDAEGRYVYSLNRKLNP